MDGALRSGESATGSATEDEPRRSRGQVLAVLQASAVPMPVDAVARRVGLHLNTVRFHLDHLVRQGAAERTAEVRSTPGRPRNLYRATHREVDRRSYRLLAEILTRSMTGPVTEPGRAARAAGRAQGRALLDPPPGARRADADSAVAGLVDVLDRAGFAPEPVTAGRRRRILLHHCPFLEAAQQNPDVVCAAHLGLMQGVLGGLRAPLTTRRLDAFVAPDLCVAHLAPARRRTRTGPAARGEITNPAPPSAG